MITSNLTWIGCSPVIVAYVISPRICHRFVGYLEEEAVITYTRQIADIDAGKLPKWNDLPAPDIGKLMTCRLLRHMLSRTLAVDYWKMPEGHRKMRDLLLYVRADEAKHREVNHTLGNLDQENDPNPYTSEYATNKARPTHGIANLKQTGWERDEAL